VQTPPTQNACSTFARKRSSFAKKKRIRRLILRSFQYFFVFYLKGELAGRRKMCLQRSRRRSPRSCC